MCTSCSKLTLKPPERRQWRRAGVFVFNFKQISHVVLVFPLLILNRFTQIPFLIAPLQQRGLFHQGNKLKEVL